MGMIRYQGKNPKQIYVLTPISRNSFWMFVFLFPSVETTHVITVVLTIGILALCACVLMRKY